MASWTKEELEQILVSTNKKFKGMKLYGADFSGMDLEKADFRSASCPFANFSNTNCQFADFEGADLAFTKWDGSNLHRANLKEANMCDADMRGVTDFFGITVTMECRTWQRLKLPSGYWYGFLFYGLLAEPPTIEDKDKLMAFFGPQRFQTLKDLYAVRRL